MLHFRTQIGKLLPHSLGDPWMLLSPRFCSRDCRKMKANTVFIDRYLIWIGSDQEKTFGPTITGLIKRNIGPERCTLWDSKARGMCEEPKGKIMTLT